MESEKKTKKEIRVQLQDKILDILSTLDLPSPTKKISKIVRQHSKKLAEVYADILKREEKKRKKAEKFMHEAVNGTKKSTAKKKPKAKAKKISKGDTVTL